MCIGVVDPTGLYRSIDTIWLYLSETGCHCRSVSVVCFPGDSFIVFCFLVCLVIFDYLLFIVLRKKNVRD